ncbi:hypothetical protein Tco_0200854 [Tanacetum coccineum]
MILIHHHHSLSPPSAGERLARCTAPPAHSPPLPPSSGCLTQIQTLRIASTQALIDAVTAALPPPPLPPSLSIPSPVDRRDDIPESEQPPRKSTVDAEERRQGIRDVGYGIRDTWVDPAEVVPEIAPMTVGEVNTRVVELAELHERDTQDLYALLEDAQEGDRMDGGGGGLCFPRGLGSFDRIEPGDSSGASDPSCLVYANENLSYRLTDTLQHAQLYSKYDTAPETLRVIRDMRREMSDMQAELLALREQRRTAGQSGPEARIPDHQEASGDADSHI